MKILELSLGDPGRCEENLSALGAYGPQPENALNLKVGCETWQGIVKSKGGINIRHRLRPRPSVIGGVIYGPQS